MNRLEAPQVKLSPEFSKVQSEVNRALAELFRLLKNPIPLKVLTSVEGTARDIPQENEIAIQADELNKRLVTKINGNLWYSNLNDGSQSTLVVTYAPADAEFVVSSTDARLPNADVLTGTANQVIVTPGTNINTLSLPQSIATTSTPQFLRLGLGAAADANLALSTTRGALIDGSADEIQLRVQGHATQTTHLLVLEDSGGNDQVTVSNDGAVVINEEGNDSDFRVESDGDANAIFVDASDNAVYFGSSASSKIGMYKSTGAVAQSTGWAVTNVTPDKTFDANSTTVDELADVLGTLITFLISRGDIGA